MQNCLIGCIHASGICPEQRSDLAASSPQPVRSAVPTPEPDMVQTKDPFSTLLASANSSLVRLVQYRFQASKLLLPPRYRFPIHISRILGNPETRPHWPKQVVVEDEGCLVCDVSGIRVTNDDSHTRLRRVQNVQAILLEDVVSLFLDELAEDAVLGLLGPPTLVCRIDRRARPGGPPVHIPKDMSNCAQQRQRPNPQHSLALLVSLVLKHFQRGFTVC